MMGIKLELEVENWKTGFFRILRKGHLNIYVVNEMWLKSATTLKQHILKGQIS